MQEKMIIAMLGAVGGMLPMLFTAIFNKIKNDNKLPIDRFETVAEANDRIREDLMDQINALKAEIKELKIENKELHEENRKLEARINELERITTQYKNVK